MVLSDFSQFIACLGLNAASAVASVTGEAAKEVASGMTLEDWVSLAGVAGFVLSLFTLGWNLWRGRKNLSVKADFECTFGEAYISSRYHYGALAFFFENRSSNPISITFLEIRCKDGSGFRCSLNRQFIANMFRRSIDPGTEDYSRFIESPDFPIDLCGYGAAYEYVVFPLPRGRAWDDVVEISVHTNRGCVRISDAPTIRKLEEFLQKPLRAKREKRPSVQQPEEIQS